jgi:hypothetical protein
MAPAAAVPGYETLGAFYLGRPRPMAAAEPAAPAAGEPPALPLLYDSRDLLTHAVCVGMTGSGKTGLLIGLLEEAAIDGIPALVIDPKGDLANLLLTFPELRPADFAPWVDADAAARAGLTLEAFAAREAEGWRRGLAAWDQDGGRIARLRAAADFAIYTPGSEAGLQISILSSLAPPPPEVLADGDLLRERIGTLVASLLALLGVDSDPLQGREAILLASVFDAAWRSGRTLDLASLIQQVQQPPLERVGVMDLETFFPARERFALAMAFNNLLGSPGFAAWLRGDPLDVDRLLYTPAGKPRVAVFSIAHLPDRERMFFVALLLNQLLGWMRGRSGTSSLRAILAMDEVFGYMPPVAEPPSKRPLLTLLKQGRAFGLGVVLATQNPVDLDYKGLANVGTWMLGRLQTERDKQRLMDGLEGAAAGGGFDRARTAQILSGLASRVFLLHNVHDEAPALFETRWTLSYLRGPLTRPEIKRLMDPAKPAAATAPAGPAAAAPAAAPAGPGLPSAPVLPPDVPQSFLPVRAKPDGVVYDPRLFAIAALHYADAKRGIAHTEELSLLVPLTAEGADGYAAEVVGLRRRAGQEKQRQADQARQQTLSSVISAGSAVLGMFFGRARSRSSLSAVGAAARNAGRTFQEHRDVSRAEESLDALERQLAALNAELEAEVGKLGERFDPAAAALETIALKPRKSDVEVRFQTLAWAPRIAGEPAWK